jgi:LysM repeat protein
MARDDERYLPPPKRRSPVPRILVALALLATLAVVFVVVSSSTGGDGEKSDSPEQASSPRSDPDKEGPETPKEVTVEAGDSLSGIAVKYGVSVKRLERLNPDLDPNTLATGQTVKLR